MYCSNCGNKNTQTAKYCCKCGVALVSKKIILHKDEVVGNKEKAEDLNQTSGNNREINTNRFSDKLKTLSKKQIKIIAFIILIIMVTCVVGAIIYKNTHKEKIVSASKIVAKSKVITFPDKNLEQVIRKQIKKPTGSILKDEVNKILSLEANEKNITNLSGIENLTNLSKLRLDKNEISNIEPLKGLTKLTNLLLKDNKIKDYTPVKSYYSKLITKDFALEYKASNDYILLNSNTEELKESDLSNLTKRQLVLARNEVFARHGLVFNSQEVKSYFESKSWYQPVLSYKGDINSIEEFNVRLIKKIEEGNTYNVPAIKNQDIISFCNDANSVLLDIQDKRNISDEIVIGSTHYLGLYEPYSSKDKMKEALSKYFTEDYVEKFISGQFFGNRQAFVEKNGRLYFMMGDVGQDSVYTYGSIKSRNNKGSIIQAVAYASYEDDGSSANEGDIKIKVEDGKWKIDSFHSVFGM